MDAAILAIGTELTRGELRDGNTCWLSEQLTGLGVDVIEQVTVDDDEPRIAAALLRLGHEVELLLVTGGLGPTSDDRTAAAAAAALGVELVRDAVAMDAIEAHYRAAGVSMPQASSKQADRPRGAVTLANAVGTAPGFRLAIARADAYFMPGVPEEMRHLFTRHVAPAVMQQVRPTSHQVHLRLFGLPESAVAQRLADLEAGGAAHDGRVTLGYRASFPEIEVKVLARAETAAAARTLAEDTAVQVRARLSPYVFGGRGSTLAGAVGQALRELGKRAATAESCTGGLVGALLTAVSGSSEYYLGSVVAYDNAIKQRLLGVGADLLERHGAVSAEVAAAMARGVLERTGADLAVAVTGVAGPGGGTEAKPVGTVWFAVAQREAGGDAETLTLHQHLRWGREQVRTLSAYLALRLLGDAALGRLDLAAYTHFLPAP